MTPARRRQLHQRQRRRRAAAGGDPEDVVVRRDRLDAGQPLDALLPVRRRVREADLERVLAGDRRLQLERRVERLQLAVIDDRDAIAELVGLVHVVRRDQDGEVRARA